MKAVPLKLLSWKVSISTDHVVFDYMISWQMKRAYATFKKAVRHQIWKKKNTESNIFIF